MFFQVGGTTDKVCIINLKLVRNLTNETEQLPIIDNMETELTMHQGKSI